MHFEQRFGARELKFLVSPTRAREIREWARARLAPDPMACAGGDTYRVTSLYFDTAGFDVFHARGSYGRAKYRVRRYNDAASVFVERKMRTDCLVSKRRVSIAIDDVPRISGDAEAEAWPGAWFQRRLAVRRLNPVCSISYLRTALVGRHSDGSLVRLTLDESLMANRADALALDPLCGGTRIAAGQEILELKYGGELPAVFKELLKTFALHRIAISKYRTAAAELGLAARKNG